MALSRLARRGKTASGELQEGDPPKGRLADGELLELFGTAPQRAWELFLDRYAGLLLSTLRQLGFDPDEAMDRFVFVCEKLCEKGFRRLRTVRYTGRDGELTPWLVAVVRNLSVSWAWSVDGRRRLFKSIADLPAFERRVFELYFWRGLAPSQVYQQLRAEGAAVLRPAEVFDALEVVFSHLSENQTWRLMSQLMRHREAVPVASEDPETGLVFEPMDTEADPEQAALQRERRKVIGDALAALVPRDRLILQLRYEEALTLKEVAQIAGLGLSAVKRSIHRSLEALRESLRDVASEDPGTSWPA